MVRTEWQCSNLEPQHSILTLFLVEDSTLHLMSSTVGTCLLYLIRPIWISMTALVFTQLGGSDILVTERYPRINVIHSFLSNIHSRQDHHSGKSFDVRSNSFESPKWFPINHHPPMQFMAIIVNLLHGLGPISPDSSPPSIWNNYGLLDPRMIK